MHNEIFRFSKSICDWTDTDLPNSKKILGGKGAGLVMMANAGLPVPPGFTITTNVCNAIASYGPDKVAANAYIDKLMFDGWTFMKWLANEFGYAPLVSVRSGAPVSMPGMMDTILNVGMTDKTLEFWTYQLGTRAALDSYRRLIQMLGHTAYGVPMEAFDAVLHDAKVKKEVANDTDLDADDLKAIVSAYKQVFQAATQQAFPQDPAEQLKAAVKAVFDSWMNPRAIEYRKINKIDPSMGTAVTVQSMVFGNMGDTSGTGVLFTRNPSTGVHVIMGEFLQNAQGEDVVAGIRTPVNFTDMTDLPAPWPSIYDSIVKLCANLEETYRDMVDIEFTVQQGELFVLQSRVGKRSAAAAFKIAVDLLEDEVIGLPEALSRLTPEQYKAVKRPIIEPSFKTEPHFTGLPACPGVVTGRPVFSAQEAVDAKDAVILVTHETNPDDIAGMNAALGILTQTGGATSHAAVVARAMDKTCVVGCTSLDWTKVKAATKLTICGATGRVWVDTEVPLVDASSNPAVHKIQRICLAFNDNRKAVTVPDKFEGQPLTPQTVCMAHWWGNIEILDAVMKRVEQVPQAEREAICLDFRGPDSFAMDADTLIEDAFGVFNPVEDDEFIERLRGHCTEKLTNVAVIGALGDSLFEEKKVAVQFGAVGISEDYAVFSVLGKMS